MLDFQTINVCMFGFQRMKPLICWISNLGKELMHKMVDILGLKFKQPLLRFIRK